MKGVRRYIAGHEFTVRGQWFRTFTTSDGVTLEQWMDRGKWQPEPGLFPTRRDARDHDRRHVATTR